MVKTMKKSLAMVLSLAVCLSIFCVPASATYADELPYMLCTYEDGAKNLSEGTIVEGGVGGSGHALQLTAEKDKDYSLRIKQVEENGTIKPTNFAAEIPAGSKFVLTFWAKAVDEISNFDFHIFEGYTFGNWATKTKSSACDGWYKWTFTVDANEAKEYGYIRFRSYFAGTCLIDDFEIALVDADAPTSSKIAVVGNATEGNEVTFRHTFTPATSSDESVTDTSLVRLVNVTEAGARGVIAVCGINETMTIPTLPADSADIEFEVVPLSSDGKAGNAVAFVAPEDSVYANELPHILCTYEDGARNLSEGTIVEGGLGGSGHAMQLTAAKDKDYSLRIKQVEENGTIKPTNFAAEIPAGSKFVLSFWAKAVGEISNFDFHIFEGYTFGNWATKTKSSACDGWYKWTFTVDANEAKEYGYIRFRSYFAGTCLIDDFEITLIDTADAPASSNFTVTGDVVAGNRIAFAHTFTPAASSEQSVTDTSLVRLVNTTSAGAKAIIAICGINETMLVPETPADSANMEFEVVPLSSDAKVGNIATYAVPVPEVIKVITLIPEDGAVIVYSDTYIESAYLIFASYDANGKMVDWEVRDPIEIYEDMPEAYGSSIEEGETTVAMLWVDFVATYKPLTNAVSW